MSGHTKGPWGLAHVACPDVKCDCGHVLVDGYFGAVATVRWSCKNPDDVVEHGDNPPKEEAIANARLIAAAPEMLEALNSAEFAEGALINEWADFWDVVPRSLIDAILKAQALRNAAIAKATGGAE